MMKLLHLHWCLGIVYQSHLLIVEEETTESPLVFKYLESKSLVSCEEPLTTFSVFNFDFTLVSV